MVGEAKAAALGANLSQHRGQGDQHPVLLLAELLTLHAPAGHQHGRIFVEQFRQFADFSRTYAADLCGPLGGFRHAVAFAGQVAGENLIAAGIARQKRIVLPAVFDQSRGDPKHHRHVRSHMRGHPVDILAKEINGFRSHRIDADHPFAALAQPIEPRHSLLIGGIPGNLQRIQRISAPQHHHVAMFQHHWPAGLLLIHLISAHYVRHDRLRRAGGVIPEVAGIAAGQTHIALQQRRRFMQYAV